MVFSIGSEFVENTVENRALYICKPVVDICKGNEWKYVIRFKEANNEIRFKFFL